MVQSIIDMLNIRELTYYVANLWNYICLNFSQSELYSQKLFTCTVSCICATVGLLFKMNFRWALQCFYFENVEHKLMVYKVRH